MKLATFSLVVILIISAAQILECKNGDNDDEDSDATKELLDAMKDVSEDISNSIKNGMKRDTSRAILFVAKDARTQVAKVEGKAKSLIVLANQKLTETEQDIDTTIEEQEDQLATWGDEETQKADGATEEQKEQIHSVVHNLLESFSNDSRSCADNILKPIKRLHEQTVKTIQGSFPLINGLGSKIVSCARLNQRVHRLTSKCASEVKKRLKPMYALHGKYTNLFNQVKKLIIKNYSKAPCAVDIVNKLKTQKTDVSKDITKIMDGTYGKDNTEITTVAAEETDAAGIIKAAGGKQGGGKQGVEIELQQIINKKLKIIY